MTGDHCGLAGGTRVVEAIDALVAVDTKSTDGTGAPCRGASPPARCAFSAACGPRATLSAVMVRCPAEYAVVIASVGIDTHRAVRSVQAALTNGSRHG